MGKKERQLAKEKDKQSDPEVPVNANVFIKLKRQQ